MILALIATLLALVVRANATPSRSASSADAAPAPVADAALAIRYANALAEPDDDDDDDDVPEDDGAGIAEVEDDDDSEAGEAVGDRERDFDRDRALGLDDDVDDFDDADSSIDDAGEPGGQIGALALLDAEQAPPGSVGDDDARLASSSAGGDETYEAWMRHRRPSRWGRLDLGLAVRQSTTAPLHTPAYRREELWLVATWRH